MRRTLIMLTFAVVAMVGCTIPPIGWGYEVTTEGPEAKGETTEPNTTPEYIFDGQIGYVLKIDGID